MTDQVTLGANLAASTSLAGPASTLPTREEAILIVGIDVHKHNHAAALIDDRGGEIATLTISNTPKGYRSLIDGLVKHGAGAGFEVLQVPAWRTHGERHRRGPGKTGPGRRALDRPRRAHTARSWGPPRSRSSCERWERSSCSAGASCATARRRSSDCVPTGCSTNPSQRTASCAVSASASWPNSPDCQRLTLRLARRMVSIIDSHGLVFCSVRFSAPLI